MRALLVALVVVAAGLAGCAAGGDDARGKLVPYPRLGDVATYAATGSLADLARWENGKPFLTEQAQVRFTLAPSEKVLDGARAVHPAFLVTTETSETGIFVKHSERYVSPEHETTVQAYYPLSQDQGIVSFDERGYPWLFGVSALFGAELVEGAEVPAEIPDNLGLGAPVALAWRVGPTVDADGAVQTRVNLVGPGVEGEAWLEQGSPWPLRVSLTLKQAGATPLLRSDSGFPASIHATRVDVTPGGEPVPPRNRGATFGQDELVPRVAWDGEKPPDGDAGYVSYALADAVRDAKLLDRGFSTFAAAGDARLYRGTFMEGPGPADGVRDAYWLLQFVNQDNAYYQVEIERLTPSALGVGVPRVNSSGPAEAPADPNHGWFPADALPGKLVPLSAGFDVVRDVFGAEGIQIFLRSFAQPPGYSYYLDGGWETPGGRYTVVYNPTTGFVEQATGPVSPRFAA